MRALCPDGRIRTYRLNPAGQAVVGTPGGSQVTGTIRQGRFRPDAQHHGAHRMWYPTPTTRKTP
jgi:hypothetical protein